MKTKVKLFFDLNAKIIYTNTSLNNGIWQMNLFALFFEKGYGLSFINFRENFLTDNHFANFSMNLFSKNNLSWFLG